MNSTESKRRSSGFSLVEMLMVVSTIAVLAALAMPSLTQARRVSNETAAISAMRTINSAQASYYVRTGTYGTLADLMSRSLIDSTLAQPSRSGYVFAVGTVTDSDWDLNADPSSPGSSGDRYFYVDVSGVIRYSDTGTANSSDNAVQ